MLEAVVPLGKPVVLVLMTGRPLDITWAVSHVPAILNVWYPGTEGGHAVANLLTGDANPSGHLPVTWPREVGQIPIFYNTNLTQIPNETRRYWDVSSLPLYPFGYGLSYSTFTLSDLTVTGKKVHGSAPLCAGVGQGPGIPRLSRGEEGYAPGSCHRTNELGAPLATRCPRASRGQPSARSRSRPASPKRCSLRWRQKTFLSGARRCATVCWSPGRSMCGSGDGYSMAEAALEHSKWQQLSRFVAVCFSLLNSGKSKAATRSHLMQVNGWFRHIKGLFKSGQDAQNALKMRKFGHPLKDRGDQTT